MHSRALHHLSYACLALFAAYLALVATTLFFASVRTSLSGELDTKRSEVAALETEYYDAIAAINDADVAYAGFVSPRLVEYVSKGGSTAVTRADR